MPKDYALYKGDELLDVCTLEDIAERRGVSPNTIYYYSMPAYQRKPCKKSTGKRMIAIPIDDD